METNLCKNCNQTFLVNDEDSNFYQKINVPPPTHCPTCRQIRRLAWRNEHNLYQRKCDLCKKNIISIYSEDSGFTVFCNNCWWSDKWDAMKYALDFDFKRPFFEQFKKLQAKVPRLGIYLKNAVNSDYCNHSEMIKNCYLSVDVANGENIYYSKWIIKNCSDLCDCHQNHGSELCYETCFTEKGYNLDYAFAADNSRDSAFIYDCKGCANCFMCWNLRHKQYCIENRQLEKEEYEKIISETDLGSYETFQKCKNRFLEIVKKTAVKQFQKGSFNENVSGDLIYKCKNVHESFCVVDSEDCKYCYDSAGLKDCYDTYEAGFNCELQYDSHACNRGTRVRFGHVSYDIDNCDYVDSCHNSSELFGCIGLRHKKYCIFNKQYSKEDYGKLCDQIIGHMEKTDEFGEFFPIKHSPFCYNESAAMDRFPLTKEQAEAKGYHFRENDKKEYRQQNCEIPDNIRDTTELIINEIMACKKCGKNYRIAKAELQFYKKMRLPIPRKCSNCRYIERINNFEPPHRLLENNCKKCNQPIKTPFSPQEADVVYCEKCYEEFVYE